MHMSDDDTRVVLASDPRTPGSDYINANYISVRKLVNSLSLKKNVAFENVISLTQGYRQDQEYIATQGIYLLHAYILCCSPIPILHSTFLWAVLLFRSLSLSLPSPSSLVVACRPYCQHHC